VPWTSLPDPDGVPPRRVGDDLDTIVRRAGVTGGQAAAAVFTRWEEAVGSSVAIHAHPVSVRGTTLVVGVDGPAYATQLRMLIPQLIGRLADLTGVGVIDSIDVRVRA